jgi:hypothetical protein
MNTLDNNTLALILNFASRDESRFTCFAWICREVSKAWLMAISEHGRTLRRK